jgi:hypothetical protein
MLVFLTSIRHPDSSTSYGKVEQLFEMALRSLCAQDDGDFRVVVVCNTRPAIGYADPRVSYHVVDFPRPSDGPWATGRDAKAIDKGTKLLSGMLFARTFAPDHIALVDADDLVSRRIAGFVNGRPEAAGWYVDAGYTFNYVTGRLQRRHSLVRYCGTGVIVSAPALYELSHAVDRGLDESSSQEELWRDASSSFVEHVLCDHRFTVAYLAGHGFDLEPLPFRAVAWVQETGENYSRPKGTVTGVAVPPSFRREFAMGDVPVGTSDTTIVDRLREVMVSAQSRMGSILDPISSRG